MRNLFGKSTPATAPESLIDNVIPANTGVYLTFAYPMRVCQVLANPKTTQGNVTVWFNDSTSRTTDQDFDGVAESGSPVCNPDGVRVDGVMVLSDVDMVYGTDLTVKGWR